MPAGEKIKILETIRQGQIGGGETHVLDLVRNINKSVFEPVVLSFTDGPMIDRLNEMGIKNFVIPSLKAFDFMQWKKIIRLLRREKIDIIHAHGSRAASNLIMAAKYLRLPIIYTVHGWSFHDDQKFWIKKLRILSEKFLVKNVNSTIAVSASNQQTGKEYCGNFNSVVINNGIDLHRFDPLASYPDIRAELGIPPDYLLISYIARITSQKDPITLLDAFKEVLSSIKNIRLLIVGDGDLKDKALSHAKAIGIDKEIIFQPFRQDIPAILCASDIYCLPSLWEGMPIGLLEAMAMKNAVIATEVDGSKEIIVNSKNGLLVPVQQPLALAKAVIKICKDDFLRKNLQDNARQTVADKYNIQTTATQIECVYESFNSSNQPIVYARQ